MQKIIEWWDTSETPDVHKKVFELAKSLQEAQKGHQKDSLNWYRLFKGAELGEMQPHKYAVAYSNKKDQINLNIVHSMCTTVTSRIAKNQPKVNFLTSGGDYSLKRKAELLNKFVGGQFYATDIYKTAPRVFLDSTIFGTGVMKVYHDGDDIKCERILPTELLVDDAESFYGEPRQMFQRKTVSREVLMAAFPEFREKILNAPKIEDINDTSIATTQVEVLEAWHLPSRKGAGDGKRAICIENATLVVESYDKPYFPFVFIRWSEPLLGCWGQGLAEQLCGIQKEIDVLLGRIQEQMAMATPVVFLERSSDINKKHLTDVPWNVVEFDNVPPVFHVPRTVSGEIFTHLDRLYARAYEVAGVSQMAAQAKKPAGLDSGVAIREFSDIQSDRFMLVAQAYESMYIEAARQIVNIARDLAEDGDLEVASHGDREIERIKWSEIDLEESQYALKPYPTSLLSTTPAARLQTVQEMAATGLLNPAQALTLLDFPDLKHVTELLTANVDAIDLAIETMIEHGRYVNPDTFLDLRMAVTRVQQAYNRAVLNNVPQERLDMLQDYVEACVSIMKEQQAKLKAEAAEQQQQQQPKPQLMGQAAVPSPIEGGPLPQDLGKEAE